MTYSEQILQKIEAGKLDQIQELIDQAVQKDSKEYLLALINQLFYLGFLEEAKKIIQKLQQQGDHDLQYNLTLAEIAIEDGDLDQALDYLAMIPKDDDNYVASLVITADIYQVLGIPEVSIQKLKEAIELSPDDDILVFALAELYYHIGEYEQAVPRYQKLLNDGQQNITDISINERLGTSLSILGDFEEAIPYLEASLEENESDDQLFYLGYTYLQLGENEKAIHLFERLVELNDTYQSVYLYLAMAYEKEERLDEALATAEKGLTIDKYQSRLYQMIAKIKASQGEMAEAEQYLNKAISYDQGETARQDLADLYVKQGEYEQAINVINQMQELDGFAYWTLAQSYRALENDAKAMQYYTDAAQELADQLDFMRDYGLYLREIGQLDQSKHYLEHYMAHVADDYEIEELLQQMDDEFNF